jgi:predicted AlkP superfamily pyrophosphatase or phosphodiesterase
MGFDMARRRLILFVFLFLTALVFGQQERPYVVLVSLDGFRYDYAEKFEAKNILNIRNAGASAEWMVPSFPTVTFPNHITIATGMYPGHHGIVANHFWDPVRKEEYSMSEGTDGSWYREKPLWVVAEEQGVKTAAMFWPTSDAEIKGVRPSQWMLYDGKFPNEQRVAKVLEWLKLPAEQRPHFVTLYFSDVDTAGHDFGPEAAETAAAVQRVDASIGVLWKGLQATGLAVNLIVVSDHGMDRVSELLNLRDYADLSKVRVITAGAYALIYTPDLRTAEELYPQFKGKSPKFEIYRRKETPKHWHYSEDPRAGDLVLIANQTVRFVTSPPKNPPKGQHGYDPEQFKTMNAVFYAIGPNIKPKERIKPFPNIDVFPFITKILDIRNPNGIDGTVKSLNRIYRSPEEKK